MSGASEFDTDKFDTLLPTETVHSLRQVQATYGALAEAASGGSTPTGQEEYSLYFTPSELEPFIVSDDDDEERYLVSVKVDFTEDDPSCKGIEVVPLSREVAPRLGLSRYPWGRGIDHSITRCGSKTSGSSASTVVTYCTECLTRWTNGDGGEPAVGNVADEHPDGWLIHALAELGATEKIQDRIEQEVNAKINGEPRVVATVKLKLDPATLEDPPVGNEPGWFYPGEVPVFNEAMRARKARKYITKNVNGTSEGDAACMITGEDDHVVGAAEDPFALFTLQHTEKFDELKRDQSWREHPVSDDAALLLDAGTGLLDACRETRNGLGIYTLPYFMTMSDERAKLLYRTLSELQDTDLEEEHKIAWLQRKVEEYADKTGDESHVDALRFYTIAIRDDQGDIFVFNEEPDATIYPPREISKAHVGVLSSLSFSEIGFSQPDDWRHIRELTDPKAVVSNILGGTYAQDTVSFTEGTDGATANEPSEWLSFAMLAGEQINREWLLDQYVTRLTQQRERDDESRLSWKHVLTQFAQLDALARAGLLAHSDGRENGRRKTDMNNQSTTDGVSNPIAELPNAEELTTEGVPSLAEVREYRLREFLAERTELSGDAEEHEQRRGAFLIGVLLGQLSTHQRQDRGMNRTFANRYQAEDITLGQLQKVMTELLSKDSIYEAEHDYSNNGSCFPETSGRLSDLAGTPPTKWSLSLPDVRFHFALGVTYGLQSRDQAFELRDLIEDSLADEPEETANA